MTKGVIPATWFKAMRGEHAAAVECVWEQLQRAMESGNWSVARELCRDLAGMLRTDPVALPPDAHWGLIPRS